MLEDDFTEEPFKKGVILHWCVSKRKVLYSVSERGFQVLVKVGVVLELLKRFFIVGTVNYMELLKSAEGTCKENGNEVRLKLCGLDDELCDIRLGLNFILKTTGLVAEDFVHGDCDCKIEECERLKRILEDEILDQKLPSFVIDGHLIEGQ